MMMRRRALPALLAPMLNACRSGSGTSLHIGVQRGLVESYPVHLAVALGHFSAEGLEATIQELVDSRLTESLLGGSTDAVYNSYAQILMLGGEARQLRCIFVGAETLSSLLTVSESRASQIQRVEDLKGASVGVASLGGPQNQFLEVILNKHGLTGQDVHIVAYGNAASAVASLQYGKVDAGMINGSAFHVLKRRSPKVRVLVDPRSRRTTTELTGIDPFPNFSLFTKVSWLEQNPVAARKLTKAMVRTLRWVHSHSAEELREHLPASLRSEDAEADLATIRLLMNGASKDGCMPPEAPAGVLRFVAITNNSVRDANIDLTGTYTNQFVEEASR